MSTRDAIAAAADRLFYENGFDATSFSDVAAAVGISRGNFYYHFRAKDDILAAVIERRLEHTAEMLARWEASSDDPAERIRCFIDMLIENRGKIVMHGCPVGTLCTELAKFDHAALGRASEVFTLFREWLRRQFEALGDEARADALAMHVLSQSQGIATLANAFHDESFIRTQVDELHDWVDGLARKAD